MMYNEDLDKDLKLAYDNYMMAVRNGNRDQIDSTKMMLDMLTDEKNMKINGLANQKNTKKNQNNP